MSRTYRDSKALTRFTRQSPRGHVKNEIAEMDAKEDGVKCKVRDIPTWWDDRGTRNECGQVYRALNRMFEKNMEDKEIIGCLVDKWKLPKTQAMDMTERHREWFEENKQRDAERKAINTHENAEKACKRVLGNIAKVGLCQLHQVVHRLNQLLRPKGTEYVKPGALNIRAVDTRPAC